MTAPLASDRFRRVIDLFNDAADVPPEARSAWLDTACGGDADLRREVESLLASDAAATQQTPFAQAIQSAIADAAAAVPSVDRLQRIGPYRLLDEIGAGGMGTVFLAERDDEFRQRVAVKVARGALGADAMRRFRAERQILASLEHPLIGRLLDGGTTPDGVPYLVMEHVDGTPIDRYARVRQLTVRERVELFCRVCDAVNHAHHRLVVHRDLKPSNILVTADGTPKLLDFGIAKLLDQSVVPDVPVTLTGVRMLTPEYASPEQIRSEPITTSTDVYALGVILFELLTGERPLAFDTHQVAEIERVVCHVEPRKPSLVAAPGRDARQLAGDLDTIVLTALTKEPDRRYQSAARLAEDLRRYLDGRPILARPATLGYRASRFVHRHRLGVGVAAVIVGLVVAFTVALGVQVRRVARQRDAVEQIGNLLMAAYAAYDPSESRNAITNPVDLLERGAARIRGELKEQPEMQARMLDSIGTTYSAIAQFDRAVTVLKESLHVREAAGSGATLAAAATMNRIASASFANPRALAEGEQFAERALEIRRRWAGPRAVETAESLNTLGSIKYTYRGQNFEASRLIAEAVDIWYGDARADNPALYNGLRNLMLTWRERADYLKGEGFDRALFDRAERVERLLLANRRKALGDAHLQTGRSLSSLAMILHVLGREPEAESLLRESIATRVRAVGRRDHASPIESIHNLALVLHDQGRLDEAEPLYREVVQSFRSSMGIHAHLATNINNLATVLEDEKKWDEAEAAYREAIAIRRQKLGADHPSVARTLHNLARLLCEQGRFAEALPIADEALAIRRAKLGDRHYETATSMVTRARVLAGLGRRAEAAPLARDGHAIRAAALLPDDPRLRADAKLLETLR